jgi:hypothetical protein
MENMEEKKVEISQRRTETAKPDRLLSKEKHCFLDETK